MVLDIKQDIKQDIKIVKTKLGYSYKITAYEYSHNEHSYIKLWDFHGDKSYGRLTKEDAMLDAKEDLTWLMRGINPKAGKKYFKSF